MLNISKMRWPYREDTAFSLLALAVFVLPLAFSFYSNENFESVKFALFLMLLGGSLLFWVLKNLRAEQSLKFNKKLLSVVGLLALWSLLSALFAPDKIYSFFGFYYRYTSGFIFLIGWLLFIFLLWQLLTRQRMEFLIRLTVVSGLVVALFTFFQGLGWIIYPGLDWGGFFRGPSLLGNTNYSAMFLVCVVPLAVNSFYQTKIFYSKVYYAFVVFWLLFAALILFSRGALLALVFGLAFTMFMVVVFKNGKKLFWNLFWGGFAIVLAGIAMLSISRPGALAGLTGGSDANVDTRLYAFSVTTNIIKDHPFFGSGLGNYAVQFISHQQSSLAATIGVFDDAHNWFLHIAASAGLPFLVLVIWLIFSICLTAWKNIGSSFDSTAVSLLVSLVIWLAASCFNPVSIPMYVFLAFLLASLSYQEFVIKKTKINLTVTVVTALIASFILIFGVVSFVSEHLLGAAIRAYNSEDYKSSYNLSSWAWMINPTNDLYLSYKAASEIQLSVPPSSSESDISKLMSVHKFIPGTYAEASDLYGLLYQATQNKNYLMGAADSLQQSLVIDPFFADRYGLLALYQFQLGDTAKAKINVQKNLTLQTSNFSAWILLARLYQLEGNRPGVIDALSHAFSLQPHIAQLKYLLHVAKMLPNIQQVPIQIMARQPTP